MIRRIAVLFDNSLRPETTGFYCRRALGGMSQLGQISQIEHFLPTDIPRLIEESPRWDLIFAVDDGLDYELPTDGPPVAWWAIDTHLEFDRCRRRAERARWTFSAQKDGAERLRQCGIEATWLPLACDPDIHGQQAVTEEYDLCFVGNVFPGERSRLVNLLSQRFRGMFVGQKYFQEMAAVYSASKLVFNRSIANDVNMRVFEGLASGSLLITNDLRENGLSELFQEGVHLATYRSDDELLDKVHFYLTHDEARAQVAAAGQAEVLTRHTYRHRMEEMLASIARAQSARPVTRAMPRKEKGQSVPNPPNEAIPALTKEAGYFAFDRPDVQELVPRSARRILDLGCGSGRLGAALKKRQSAHVTGVELNAGAADLARAALDDVRIANLEADEFGFADGQFDCVICADILEHLRAPERLLRKIRRWLQSDGTFVASVPNVRHHTVVRSLLCGNWTYESAGLLDEDHSRFFTRRELEKLLFRAGFEMDELRIVPGEGFDEWQKEGRPRQISLGGLQVRTASSEEAIEFFAYQYLVRSRLAPSRELGLTSIIIVTWNQFSYTRNCLDSVRLRTDEPFEIIVVDNGSTDGTVEYLRAQPNVRLIENRENRGFPAAVNQGMAVATGAQLLLLNNDTLVSTGWLRRMLDVLHSAPQIGLVGPVSNQVGSEQQIPVTYEHLNDLDGFAWNLQRELPRRSEPLIQETDRLIGFCLLIKREVVDRVGTFDERFGVGCFEDDDYCRRAIAAGYRAVIARQAFVHHFGSVTFQSSGTDLERVLQNGKRLYDEKWRGNGHAHAEQPLRNGVDSLTLKVNGARQTSHGESERTRFDATKRLDAANPSRPDFILGQDADGNLLIAPNTHRLSGCLIVRNNGTTIRPCLESLKGWVDEMIVVDTGSTDSTPAIAAELGARVFHWPWSDDFAAARNVSVDHARGEWIFWMDSDDTLPEECGRKLRALADGDHPANLFGYVMQVHCPGDDPADVTIVDHLKLFRNRPDLRFEFRIHEQVLPAIRRANGDVAFTDIYVVHSGSDRSKSGQARKLERDFRLLQLELADRPDHPFVLFNLGMTYADCGQHADAILSLRRCVEVSGHGESHLRKAYALLINSLMQSQQVTEAEQVCRRGIQLFPDDKELLFRKAILEHHQGRLREAVGTYERVLSGSSERHFTSVDAGLDGFKARHNLALVYEDLHDDLAASAEWEQILREQPHYVPAWRGLADALLKLGRVNEFERLVASLQQSPDDGLRHLVPYCRGKQAEARGAIDDALAAFEEAERLEPSETAPLRQSCRLLFENSRWSRACEKLERLSERAPEDPCVHHNLGVARWRSGEGEQAAVDFRRSLDLRPFSVETWLHLGWTYRDCGREEEASECWSRVLELSPGHPEAASALSSGKAKEDHNKLGMSVAVR